jgi:SAM-dependent methyltransferase
MPPADIDHAFTGSIPEWYERAMVPLFFEPCAADLAPRIAALRPRRVLELACGTGALTRALARALPPEVEIVATDLNGPMLAQAAATGTARPVTWQVADAMQLPFEAASFDVVACQFGVMFFPDKGGAHAEARRMLRPGGHLVFSVWGSLEDNDLPDTVTRALAAHFPADPPTFMARVPHGYHDPATIAHDLARGGFAAAPAISTFDAPCLAASARVVAEGLCRGTPMRSEIASRDPGGLDAATAAAEQALVARFGTGDVAGRMRALVVVAAG